MVMHKNKEFKIDISHVRPKRMVHFEILILLFYSLTSKVVDTFSGDYRL